MIPMETTMMMTMNGSERRRRNRSFFGCFFRRINRDFSVASPLLNTGTIVCVKKRINRDFPVNPPRDAEATGLYIDCV